MSQAINIRKFLTFFVLYTVASLVIFLGTSFTILGWLVYLFSLVPFYVICMAYVLMMALKPNKKEVKYRISLLYSVLLFQLLLILTSPASCYGFNQGKACYSFIQAHLTNADLTSVQNNPTHWSVVELIFPCAVLLYMISLIVLLGTIRSEKNGVD